jgi:hypothetical protein
MGFLVIRDTREKPEHGWEWIKSKECDGTEIRTLESADYTLDGLEQTLAIERKGCVAEWAGNLTDDGRFEKELDRLQLFKHSFVILEFDFKDIMNYPYSSGIPKSKWRYIKIRGPFLLKRTVELITKYYRTQFLFCGKFGKDIALSIFKRIYAKHKHK